LLNKRIKISEKLKNHQITCNDLIFYKQYADYTKKVINREKFQRFIKQILEKEKISENKIHQIYIRVLPSKNDAGQWIIGKCNHRGEIKIFPKERSLCLKIAYKLGKKALFSYIKNRANAALIHELLHLKYLKDEKRVRNLTRKYFKIYNQKKIPNSAINLLFPQFSS
jgi:predicted metal-dependent hydrolase